MLKLVAALCAASLTPFAMAQTSMVKVVEEHGLNQCGPQLEALANRVIGENSHRLHMDMPKGNADQYPLVINGVISYQDREAQLLFTASPMLGGGCEVSAQESYFIEETCVKVRERMFKKWRFIGNFSGDSFFLRHKETLTRNATLSNHGEHCLVSRRDSGI